MTKSELPRVPHSERRRHSDKLLLKTTLLACMFAANVGVAFGACSPAPSLERASTNQNSFWGLHLAAPGYLPWPTVSYNTVRAVSVWRDVSWEEINTANGTYYWGGIDFFVDAMTRQGKEILYTFNRPPQWAGEPTETNLRPWINFVNAVVSRYCNVIKYWELWNEPNSPVAWTGSVASLVAMAKAAYPIIKNRGGVVVSPGAQGYYAYKWLSEFFARGGGAYVDIIAFHGYTFGSPETVVPLIQNVRNTMAAYGHSRKQLWDTEHSWWYGTSGYGDSEWNQSQFLARHVILENSLGVDRAYWYMWETAGDLPGLFNRDTSAIRAPGKVYQLVHDWLIGNKVICTTSGDIYSCAIGSSRAIYWHALGWSTSIVVDNKYTTAQNIFGTTSTISNHRINISGVPVMVK